MRDRVKNLNPDWNWLMRNIHPSTETSPELVANSDKKVFCHLYTEDMSETHKGFGNTMEEAWDAALASIHRGVH